MSVKASMATVGGVSLAVVALDDHLILQIAMLVIITFVMIMFWLGVVRPAVWSRDQARQLTAQIVLAILLGRDAAIILRFRDDQKALDRKPPDKSGPG